MTDRELLELAAKAYGAGQYPETGQWEYFFERVPSGEDDFKEWNPLDDDGDALRLAVKLGLDLLRTERDVEAIAGLPPQIKMDAHQISALCAIELLGTDTYAATRRAIVRAAAEIGRAMP